MFTFRQEISHQQPQITKTAMLPYKQSRVATFPPHDASVKLPKTPLFLEQQSDARRLYSNDDYSSYFVDSDGNSIDPYSMGWRYLGMFIDCPDNNDDDDDAASRDGKDRRQLNSQSGDNECARKVLWAAVRIKKS